MAISPPKSYSNPTLQGQLQMARDALTAQQSAMSMIGHNVANADTEGYTRRRAELVTRTAIDGNPGQIGMGVKLAEIERMANEFVNEQVRSENANQSRWEAQRDAVLMIEESFGELNEYGLASMMDEFWNAWQDFAADADSIAPRIALLEAAQNMTTAFNNTAKGMLNIQEQLNIDLKSYVEDINTLSSNITELNIKINKAVTRGQSPNDMMDERDRLLKQLSKISGATIEQNGDGTVSVYIGSDLIVGKDKYREVYWKTDTSKGKTGGNIVFKDNNSELRPGGGEIMGKMVARDEVLPTTMNELDQLALSIRNRVNELHLTGIGRDGSSNNLFFQNTGQGAIDFYLNEEIINNPSKIAASAQSSTGANELAHSMFELQFEKVFNDGTATAGEFYRGTVARVGSLNKHADVQIEAAVAGVEQAETWQQHYAGVNMDEEMANMLTYQRMYTAAAKVLNRVDEMIQIAIGLGA